MKLWEVLKIADEKPATKYRRKEWKEAVWCQNTSELWDVDLDRYDVQQDDWEIVEPKTAGQVAYEAYQASPPAVPDPLPWAKLTPETQAAWERAAYAICRHDKEKNNDPR